MLPKFEIFRPDTVEEACRLMSEHADERTDILAGGTDILVDIRRKIIPSHLPRCKGCATRIIEPAEPPSYLVALSKIEQLGRIIEDGSGEIHIGPLVTITELAESPLVREKLPALADGADNLGSPLVRNRGTIGGNICNARPAADTLIPASALNCRLILASASGERTVGIDDFITGPGKTSRRKDEILTDIMFPATPEKSSGACIKVANRKSLEISVVNVASVISLDSGGKISHARISMGAVGPKPMLADKAAESLIGKAPSDDLFTEAGQIASTECKPITDHRGGADYRLEMVRVLVKRTLMKAVERI